MEEFSSAYGLLGPNEKALVIYTDGRHLAENGDGTGSTGWWRINKKRKVDRVIIYHRKSKDQTDNDLFTGSFDKVEGPNEDGRFTLHLVDYKLAGKTSADWRSFADTFSKEIRYIPDQRNPNWNRDELILALELYLKNPKSPPSKKSAEVVNLSEELNKLQAVLGGKPSSTLRNVNGVYIKMMNFRRFDISFTSQGKKGMTHGNALEEVVWNEFSNDRVRLAKTCLAIRQSLKELPTIPIEEDEEEEIVEASEGKLLTRIHRRRERSRKLVAAKKKQVLKNLGALLCEVCSFDFSKRYGVRGEGFIECHHTKPVHEYGDGRKTTIHELSLVCANCHRMIHSKRPWLSVLELRSTLQS